MSFLRGLWTITRPYWRSKDRWVGIALLAAAILSELGLTAAGVGFNTWNGPFYNSIHNRDADAFIHQFFVWWQWFALLVVAVAANSYFSGMLGLRWRRWLTEHMSGKWLNGYAYYRIQLNGQRTDNPDQRIAEDVRVFTDKFIELFLGLIHAALGFASFAVILWVLSNKFDFFGLSVPGFLCWAALAYAIISTTATFVIGRKLPPLEYQHQRLEADYRFSLMRIRENAQSIALSRGENQEARTLDERFGKVYLNWVAVIVSKTSVAVTNRFFGQFTNLFPLALMAPGYFAGNLQLGDLMQAQGAFWQIELSLRWLATNYVTISELRATVDRLVRFDEAIRSAVTTNGPDHREKADQEALTVKSIDLRLPDGSVLAKELSLSFPKGTRTLIAGPSGTGKSTLLNAIAGIWPHGSGEVVLPEGCRLMFLPQRTYLPVGSLRQAIIYPGSVDSYDTAAIVRVLNRCGLDFLTSRLDEEDHWSLRLSPGEQQRLVFCRAILFRPDILFLDEATSSIDIATEAILYRLLLDELPDCAIVSIAHRSTVEAFHHRRVDFSQFGAGPEESRGRRKPEEPDWTGAATIDKQRVD
ncbi:ABC transporter ATP-binding protein/permease [Rhodomicrobium lacus]|uniref:ABC transporter ATP-binding protein/permease n=1 Tax=Rhodomicrobium lacus TaxID=2498452 RepID=UPI000F8D44C7|nr:ABC transporter ATP-binding protein/permease [Rhodomicrobium lacus]